MGSCVSTFHTLCIPYNRSPKSINVHNWFLDNNTIIWTHKFSVLNKHFWHCRAYCREMNKATIRSSLLHTSEREGAFLQILHKLDTLLVSTALGDSHVFPLCINSIFIVYWTEILIYESVKLGKIIKLCFMCITRRKTVCIIRVRVREVYLLIYHICYIFLM